MMDVGVNGNILVSEKLTKKTGCQASVPFGSLTAC
jgi:hypothetical protein